MILKNYIRRRRVQQTATALSFSHPVFLKIPLQYSEGASFEKLNMKTCLFGTTITLVMLLAPSLQAQKRALPPEARRRRGRFAREHKALAGFALESSDKYLLKLFPPV